jgi:hypothetical protein
MKKYYDALGYAQLWAVRWLTGTFFIAQIIGGLVGSYTQPFGINTNNFWMGGALSMVPGFALGLLAQYKMDREKLAEYWPTVWVTGLIAVLVFGFAVMRATHPIHAG